MLNFNLAKGFDFVEVMRTAARFLPGTLEDKFLQAEIGDAEEFVKRMNRICFNAGLKEGEPFRIVLTDSQYSLAQRSRILMQDYLRLWDSFKEYRECAYFVDYELHPEVMGG